MTLRYGPKAKQLGLGLPLDQFKDLSLHTGRIIQDTKKPKSFCSFELYGIEVIVTDQSTVNHILDLTQIGKDAAEVEPYLHRVMFLALEQQPEYLEQRMKAEFDRGVQEGRKQKVKEFRKVLSD